jgi:hypothetical protein
MQHHSSVLTIIQSLVEFRQGDQKSPLHELYLMRTWGGLTNLAKLTSPNPSRLTLKDRRQRIKTLFQSNIEVLLLADRQAAKYMKKNRYRN